MSSRPVWERPWLILGTKKRSFTGRKSEQTDRKLQELSKHVKVAEYKLIIYRWWLHSYSSSNGQMEFEIKSMLQFTLVPTEDEGLRCKFCMRKLSKQPEWSKRETKEGSLLQRSCLHLHLGYHLASGEDSSALQCTSVISPYGLARDATVDFGPSAFDWTL